MLMRQTLARFQMIVIALFAAVLALAAPQMVVAQDAPIIEQEGPIDPIDPGASNAVVDMTDPGAEAYTPMAPTKGKGMPIDPRGDDPDAIWKSMTFQDQYSKDGDYALWMHDVILLPVITAISLLVLGLLVYVVIRYNRRSSPVPSRTTHNTLVEVVWTIVPVIILVVIAVPSITLLARQYETPPADAITVKAVGYQWYWGYEYPDHDIELVSAMLNKPGGPRLTGARAVGSESWDGPGNLEVDNRMVVPAGVPLRLQTTGADVIHSFAVPSLWFKQDAVPGRLNERILTIEEPGVYYGQCSELCGSKHAYMPIVVEALPMEQFESWVRAQGGTIPGEPDPEDTLPINQEAGAPVVDEGDVDADIPAP
ncbi:MAG: cytochrome c oxidase subunit II [Erythrobacter sp.]